MHPRLAELTDFLTRARAELVELVTTVPEADRERRPADERWSVAELLDHLRVVEAGSAALLARRVARAREAGIGPDRESSSVLGRLDDAGVTTDGGFRTAPEIVRPREGARFDEALAGLATSRAALLDVARQLEDVDATQVRATHAALGEIDAYQWLLFVGQHERRHLRQLAGIAVELAGRA